MNINFLVTQSLDSPSGLGRYAPLAKELTKLGQKVVIYALHPDYSHLIESDYSIDGVEVHYLGQMHVLKRQDSKSYFPTAKLIRVSLNAAIQLSSAAMKAPAGIIHICKPHPMNGLAGWLTTFKHGNQVWLDCDDYEAASGRFVSRWQYQIVAWFERWMPQKAHRISVNTYFMRDKLISWGIPESKILYLPNGVDRSRFRQQDWDKVEALRVQFKLEQKRVIAYIGSFSLPSHAIDILLKAFSLLHREIPQSVLLLVGGGEDYETLKSQACELGLAENVIFSGRIRPEEIPAYYRLADITVDPVKNDDAARGRSPLKCFESWAAGTPFITADVGDRRKLLGEPPAGCLSKPGDPASLADTILSALNDPDLLVELKLRGSQRVESYYWDKLAPQLLDAYIAQSSH